MAFDPSSSAPLTERHRFGSDFFDDRHYKVNKILLSTVGQWPYQNNFKKRLLQGLVLLALLSFFLIEIAGCYTFRHDLDNAMECVCATIMVLIWLVKTINAIAHEKNMKELLEKIANYWASIELTTEYEILDKYAGTGRTVTILYAGYTFIAGAIFLSTPLFPLILDVIIPLNESRDRRPLIQSEYFVDQEAYFNTLYLHTCAVVSTTLTIMVVIDSTYVVLVTHACGLFAILGHRLERGIVFNDELVMHKKVDNIYSQVVKCIDKHKETLEFSGLVESMYVTSYFIQLGLNILLISCAGMLILINIRNLFQLLQFGLTISVLIFTLLCNCYPGQKLIDHSYNIRESIYKSEWYRMSTKSQKLLVLMILRSSKPCKITAGKIYVMSMASFGTIVRSAISYFTVLSSIR